MAAVDQVLQFPVFLGRSTVRALRSWQVVVPLAVLTLAGLGSAYFANKIGWAATALTVGIEIAAIALWGAFLDAVGLSEADRTEHRQHLQQWAKQLQQGAQPVESNSQQLHRMLCEHSQQIAEQCETLNRARSASADAWRDVQQDVQQEDYTKNGQSWLESEASGWIQTGQGGFVRVEEWRQWSTSAGQLFSEGGPIYDLKPGDGESVVQEKQKAFVSALGSMGTRSSVERARIAHLLRDEARRELDIRLADFIHAVRIPGLCRKCSATSRW